MVVDDVDINRMILSEILSDDYDVYEAADGMEALKIIFEDEILPTAVLLDIIMPKVDGFEVLEKLKADPKTANIPVLFITAADSVSTESRVLKAGAVDYVSKPFNPDVVKTRLDNHISLKRYQNNLEEMVAEKTSEVTKTYEQTLEVLATIIEYRNLESGEHVKRTVMLMRIFVEKLLTIPMFRELLLDVHYESMIKAAALHDIGKIGILDSILLKPGRLTEDEFEVMKTHTQVGSGIIDSIAEPLSDRDGYLEYCKEICLSHHERWDGKGYPNGLKGDEIPLSARIMSIIDVYDALVNPRVYKPSFTYKDAIEIIVEGRGTQFQKELVDAFLEVTGEFQALEESMREENSVTS